MNTKSRTDDRDLEQIHANRDELAERIARHLGTDGSLEVAPGLFFYRFSSKTGPRYGVSEPSFCVIAQGSKEVFLGNERYRYDASHYLLASAGMPLVGHIVEASKERPYLSIRLVLDPALVTAVLMETDLLAARGNGGVRALSVSRLDADLLNAVLRLVRLVDAPKDYAVISPLIAREVVYRLSLGEQSGRLRLIAAAGGRVPGIAKAIGFLRENFNKPIHMPGLARQLGMSISGFHHHFKAVTAMSPLQFQKQLRMQEARRLLLAGDVDASTAGYRVGYDDRSHFSRVYKKAFGEPPMRDVERLQAAAANRQGSLVPSGERTGRRQLAARSRRGKAS